MTWIHQLRLKFRGFCDHIYTVSSKFTEPGLVAANLVSSELSNLNELYSELHEQCLQDQALLLPVLLTHGLLPLCHTALKKKAHTDNTEWTCITIQRSCYVFLWENILFISPPHGGERSGSIRPWGNCLGNWKQRLVQWPFSRWNVA